MITDEELKAIEARVELANVHEDVKGPAQFTPEVRALVLEVRRLRSALQDQADAHMQLQDDAARLSRAISGMRQEALEDLG